MKAKTSESRSTMWYISVQCNMIVLTTSRRHTTSPVNLLRVLLRLEFVHMPGSRKSDCACNVTYFTKIKSNVWLPQYWCLNENLLKSISIRNWKCRHFEKLTCFGTSDYQWKSDCACNVTYFANIKRHVWLSKYSDFNENLLKSIFVTTWKFRHFENFENDFFENR